MMEKSYSEVCSDRPGHYSIDITVCNVPLEDIVSDDGMEDCPVCGSRLKIQTKP